MYLLRNLPAELIQVIDPILQRNSIFGHPENILVAMITDECKNVGIAQNCKDKITIVSGDKRITAPELNCDSFV